jgi:hypothetical protein
LGVDEPNASLTWTWKIRAIIRSLLPVVFVLILSYVFISAGSEPAKAWFQFLIGVPVAGLSYLLFRIPEGDGWWRRPIFYVFFVAQLIVLGITIPFAALGYLFGQSCFWSFFLWRLSARSGHKPLTFTEHELRSTMRSLTRRYAIYLAIVAVASIYLRNWELAITGAGFFGWIFFMTLAAVLRAGSKMGRVAYLLIQFALVSLPFVLIYISHGQM